MLFGVFFLAPMALVVAYSFWTQNGYQVEHAWTLANYKEVFGTAVYVNTFLTTLWMTAGDRADSRDCISVLLLVSQIRQPPLAATAPVSRHSSILGELPSPRHRLDEHLG